MKIVKLVLSLSFFVLVIGCSAPGTYMNSGEVNQTSKIHGQTFKPDIVPINAELLANFKELRTPPEYRIGPYDVLNIVVYDHPELIAATDSIGKFQLTSTVDPKQSGIVVDAKGAIFFPFAGKMKVAGLTVDQIRLRLTRRLSRYIQNPQVNVRVTIFKSKQVYVIGEVVHPGTQPLTDKPLFLLNAINQSGGLNPGTADASHIYVIRGPVSAMNAFWLNASSPQAMILAEKFCLRNNDIVYVSPSGLSSWNRVVSQILPTVQTVWYTHALLGG